MLYAIVGEDREDSLAARLAARPAHIERLQALPAGFSLNLQWRGQWTNNNLDSSEKFSLGGPYGVRAYATAEAMGDRGWLGSVELRYAVTS